MNIPISEIFASIQWEWRNTWKPSIFVRFWWCNLKCSWCDTKYSWDASIETANIMTLKDVLKQIESLKIKHIIFTWWEPTLFQKEIYEIIQWLWWEYSFELETNWSKKIDEEILKKIDQINISPKLWNSWNKEYELLIAESFFYWSVDYKFVVWNMQDLVEVDEYIKNNPYTDWIYIMPLWITKESQMNKIVIDYCIKNWYNYCLRQHIILFWDKKWV